MCTKPFSVMATGMVTNDPTIPFVYTAHTHAHTHAHTQHTHTMHTNTHTRAYNPPPHTHTHTQHAHSPTHSPIHSPTQHTHTHFHAQDHITIICTSTTELARVTPALRLPRHQRRGMCLCQEGILCRRPMVGFPRKLELCVGGEGGL